MKALLLILSVFLAILAEAQPEFLAEVPNDAQGHVYHKGNLFFKANDSLWIADSALNKTYAFAGSYPGGFVTKGGELYLAASTGIWHVDYPNSITKISNISHSQCFTEFKGEAYFYGADSLSGFELRKLTPDSVTLVKDINPGPEKSIYTDSHRLYRLTLQATDDYLFFAADDGIRGVELWRSDGTEEGTEMVKNIVDTGRSEISPIITSSAHAFFFQNRVLYETDGTPEGTVMIDTFTVSHPAYPPEETFLWDLVQNQGKFYVMATINNGWSRQLYVLSKDQPLKSMGSWGEDNILGNFFKVDSIIYAQYIYGTYRDMYFLSPDVDQLQTLARIEEYASGRLPAVTVAGQILYSTTDYDYYLNGVGSYELHQINPANPGQIKVADLYPDFQKDFSGIVELIPTDSILFFTSKNGKNKKLWKYKVEEFKHDPDLDIKNLYEVNMKTGEYKAMASGSSVNKIGDPSSTSEVQKTNLIPEMPSKANKVLYTVEWERISRTVPPFGLYGNSTDGFPFLPAYYLITIRAYDTLTNSYGNRFSTNVLFQCADSVVSYTLIDGYSNEPVRELKNGDTIRTSELTEKGNFNIAAELNVSGYPLTGMELRAGDYPPVYNRLDSSGKAPYHLFLPGFSDTSTGLVPGKYSLLFKGIIQNDLYSFGETYKPSGLKFTLIDDLITGKDKAYIPTNVICYPNPFTDRITVDAGNEKVTGWTLYSLSGKVLGERKYTGKSGLNTLLVNENLPKGSYLLKVFFKNGNFKTWVVYKM